MFLFNVLELLFQLDFMIYIFVAFAFFGVMLLLRRLIFHKGV